MTDYFDDLDKKIQNITLDQLLSATFDEDIHRYTYIKQFDSSNDVIEITFAFDDDDKEEITSFFDIFYTDIYNKQKNEIINKTINIKRGSMPKIIRKYIIDYVLSGSHFYTVTFIGANDDDKCMIEDYLIPMNMLDKNDICNYLEYISSLIRNTVEVEVGVGVGVGVDVEVEEDDYFEIINDCTFFFDVEDKAVPYVKKYYKEFISRFKSYVERKKMSLEGPIDNIRIEVHLYKDMDFFIYMNGPYTSKTFKAREKNVMEDSEKPIPLLDRVVKYDTPPSPFFSRIKMREHMDTIVKKRKRSYQMIKSKKIKKEMRLEKKRKRKMEKEKDEDEDEDDNNNKISPESEHYPMNDSYDPINRVYCNSNDWLHIDDDNIILFHKNKKYCTKRMYFRKIPYHLQLRDCGKSMFRYFNLLQIGIDNSGVVIIGRQFRRFIENKTTRYFKTQDKEKGKVTMVGVKSVMNTILSGYRLGTARKKNTVSGENISLKRIAKNYHNREENIYNPKSIEYQ